MKTKITINDPAQNGDHLREENEMTTRTLPDRIKKGTTFAALTAGLLIVALGLAVHPVTSEAKGLFSRPKSPDQIVELMKDRLDLTEDQVNAIRPMMEEKSRKMAEIREKNAGDRRAARLQMQRLRWDTELKLNTILNDDQLDKYLELRQKQHERTRRGGHHKGPMGKGFKRTPEKALARLKDRLNLTEEQSAAAGPVIRESFEKRREVFGKYRNEENVMRQAMRSEMRAIGDETHTKLSSILTDEQMKEFNKIVKERRDRAEKRRMKRNPLGWF